MELTDLQTFVSYFHVFQVVEYKAPETVLEQLHSEMRLFKKNRKIPFFVHFC
jgi:hypothetical protein